MQRKCWTIPTTRFSRSITKIILGNHIATFVDIFELVIKPSPLAVYI